MFMTIVVRVIMIVGMRVIVTAVRPMHVSVLVAMRMRVIVPAARTMNMSVVMSVIMTVMLVKHALCEFEVFGVRRVVTMLVTAAVCTGFRLERHQRFGDVDIETQQHVAQDRVVFELEVPVAHFHRGMTIAEVIRRAGEREGGGRAHEQHRLRRGFHADELTVVCDEHIAPAQHGAARQKQRDLFTRLQRRTKTALAASVERQHERRGATRERGGDASRFEALLDTT